MTAKTSNSVSRTPEYSLVRLVKAADDATSRAQRSNGIVAKAQTKLLIQVVPIVGQAPADDFAGLALGTSNPTIVIRYWNAALKQFILHGPTISIGAQGAGVPFEFEVDASGRIVMIDVTGGVAGTESVLIFAAAYNEPEAF